MKPDSQQHIKRTAAQDISLFDQSNAANFGSIYLGSDYSFNRDGTADNHHLTYSELVQKVQMLSNQLDQERQLNRNLLALNQFGHEKESGPDLEHSAQAMVKILSEILPCDIAAVVVHQDHEQRLRVLATAGPLASQVPSNPQQELSQLFHNLVHPDQQTNASRQGLVRVKPIDIGGLVFRSLLVVPLARNGQLHGMLLLASEKPEQFKQDDVPVAETAAVQLLNSWEYARQNEALTEFVQSVATLSVVQEAGSLMEMIASIARSTLNAMFSVVVFRNQQDWVVRGSGHAPQILHSLRTNASSFFEEAIKSPYTFRLRDLRKDRRTESIQLDSPDLSSLLVCPLRISGVSTGLLLAFGKAGDSAFSDSDVFLAELLVSQAAVNLESCYLNQELRTNLKTTQLLYDLSLDISQAEDLDNAAHIISRTAYRLLGARSCGLILFSSDGRKEAEVIFPSDDASITHPYSLIQQSMDSRQTIYLSEGEDLFRMAIPIQTVRRCYGALWVELSEKPEQTRHPTEEIRALINQASVALERSILLEETRYQTKEIGRAYLRLDQSYDQTLRALMRALDVRDSETEGHSERVTELAVKIGQEMGLSKNELKALTRGALLHDIGKIGISDKILLKDGPLDSHEWKDMRKHPQIGARIVQEIPALHDALPVVAFHQERWDGSGYPLGLSGVDIPLLARIFSVVDVYDALTRDRPYRQSSMTPGEAVGYLKKHSGSYFDPEVVKRFAQFIESEQSLPGQSED